jgi:hypothetical protein
MRIKPNNNCSFPPNIQYTNRNSDTYLDKLFKKSIEKKQAFRIAGPVFSLIHLTRDSLELFVDSASAVADVAINTLGAPFSRSCRNDLANSTFTLIGTPFSAVIRAVSSLCYAFCSNVNYIQGREVSYRTDTTGYRGSGFETVKEYEIVRWDPKNPESVGNEILLEQYHVDLPW